MDGAASFFTNGDRLDQRVQLHHVRDQPPAAQGPGVSRWGSASVRRGSASLREGGPHGGGQQHRGAAHMSQQQVVVSQISRLVNLRHGGSPVEATFRARCTLAARTLAPLHTRLTPTGLASPQCVRGGGPNQPIPAQREEWPCARSNRRSGACAHPRSAFIAGLKKEPTVARTPSRT